MRDTMKRTIASALIIALLAGCATMQQGTTPEQDRQAVNECRNLATQTLHVGEGEKWDEWVQACMVEYVRTAAGRQRTLDEAAAHNNSAVAAFAGGVLGFLLGAAAVANSYQPVYVMRCNAWRCY